MSHYIEHLVWLNANNTERNADRHSNAWTNSYAVGYWLSGQPEDLPELLTQLKGVFDPLDVPESFALEERDIVLREYEFRIADNPVAQAGEAMNAFLYADNSIAASVIGTPDDIMALTYDQAKALHAETHHPDNAVLVVAGDVTQRELNRAMAQADWPEGIPVADVLIPPPFDVAAFATQQFEFSDSDAAPRLIWRKVISLPEPIQFDLLEAKVALLADILRANLPGGVAGPLRFDAQLARSFDVNIWPINENNIEIEFTAAPDSGVTLTELEEAFTATLSEIAASGIPEDTYTRVLARFENFWPDWNDEDETAEWIEDYVLDRVSILRPPLSERDLKRLSDDLSLTTTNALVQQLVGDGRTAIAHIGPKESFQ
ncbi:MAG: hypothetical protein OXD48_02480 [Litoreibacter sp.]|nr:hypothetical protein [Litoreibacter sp.]